LSTLKATKEETRIHKFLKSYKTRKYSDQKIRI